MTKVDGITCSDRWSNSIKSKGNLDGYDKDTEMAALVLIDSEILLRVRTTWMVMTKIDSSTCPNRWSNSIKSKDNLDGYDKDRWQHLS